jgi:two-component system, NtrC family, sensor kinase
MDDPGFTLQDDHDRLADLGRIAGGLVHELKNPLGVILLNSELLAQNLASIPSAAERDKAERRIKRITDSAATLQAVVQAFLTFARPSRPDPEPVDLNELLASLIDEQSELMAKAGIEITLKTDDFVPQVPGDRLHLRSVFLNVLTNAREALDEHPGERRILVITRSLDGLARVVIANNGPPLPEKAATRLFEPFTTTKEGGTGLGLAIVRRLVELHHGTVTVTSDRDQGVSFTFEFPTPLGPARRRVELPVPDADVLRSTP